MTDKKIISTNWVASLASGNSPIELPKRIPATVPGSIHTDLMAQGLIADPFLDDNERLLSWIGYCDWDYDCEFDWAATDKKFTELVFEGVDTVASIYLNGTSLGEVANQHRSYRYEVQQLLKQGKNQLKVKFSSPIRYADRMSLEYGYRPHVNHHPYNSIRKMAANFGWDWGIDTSTSGLWKPVYLESFDTRIASVRPTLTLEGGTGIANVIVELAGEPARSLTVKIGDQEIEVSDPVVGENKVQLKIENPKLWSTHLEGTPNLYQLRASLGNGQEVFECQVGFRTITLEFPKDETGIGFEFHLNGKPIFIRGVNWIPNDAFLHRITKESLRQRLTQAKAANINLIRVWGGGIYETEDFYELCNELGLLVWQDFLFACASYSEEGLGQEVEAEARQNISRIMKHPSLALWNGNNENLWGHQEWNWQQRLQGKSWGAGFYYDLLPSLVAELDPGRPYTPGSPFSPDTDKLHNDPSAGSVHIWDLWNQKDYPHYLDYKPRFVAEFGWQGPANWATIKESISDEPLTPESPGMIIHQKAMSGNDKLTDGLVNHFELPNDFENWHFAMQLNQANAIRFGLEHMRSEFPNCMGSVVWQLNDCWPVTSWAAIDGKGREKPLYFSIAQAYESLLVTFSNSESGIQVNLLNNQDQEVQGTLQLDLMEFSGKVLASDKQSISLSSNSKKIVQVPAELSNPTKSSSSVLVATFAGVRKLWFFAEYKDSALESPNLELDLASTANGYQLKVTANNLVRDLVVMIDKLAPAASVNQGLISLLPGETALFEIQTSESLSFQDFQSERVLKSANQLVVGKK